MTINDLWDDYELWLEKQGLHDEEPTIELWELIGYTDDDEEIWLRTHNWN